jgi:hypothetical protein
MASDTVPAAATGPDDPTATTASPQQPRGLAGVLSAVDPARPAAGFTLTPTTDTTTQSQPGVTSADYHDETSEENTTKNASTGTAGKQQQSVWRAWMLAGAERWKKGADARNKALDIKKARAQALKVTETRTVNRSEKHVGGSTNTGASTNSNSGKSLASKSNNAGRSTGSKNSNPTGSAGRGNSSPRGGANGSTGAGGHGRGAGRNSGSSTSPAGRRNNGGTGKTNTHGPSSKKPSGSNDTAKPSKSAHGGKPQPGPSGSKGGSGSTSGGTSSGRGGGSGSSGTTGARGSTGKDGKPGKDTKGASGHGTPDKSRKVDLEKKPGSKTRPDDSKHSPNTTKTPDATAGTKDKPAAGDKTKPAADTGKKPATPTRATGTGKPINTQESRETGYRDGVRAATVAAHVEAWRDGARDGWRDRKADAAREKTRLDQAHAARTQPTQPQPQKVPPMPSYAPTTPTVTPIEVTGTDSSTVYLGAGATRPSIGRGEVRNFVTFLARLEAKTDVMHKVADVTKNLQAEAEQQATEAIQLLEDAKSVKGGEHLVSKLNQLADAAKAQAGKAEDVHKRALRAAEACKTLHSNVRTRYEPVFKAVVDSPETRPAELKFYRDHGYTPSTATAAV